ncbi:1186_t:CDS:2 [Scutellospora calospora]|uniref:1186_t:CDS:1 n=1 Tax=Scutellospora calospora TaxID=85575 RepID=A0ACA9KAM7_9GLOM|nr:1186_t:CDS:2 [Scutellospora calospora]
MKQNFILVFILLATLSIVNAQLHKRATKFNHALYLVTLTGKLDKDVPVLANSTDILEVTIHDSGVVPFTIKLCIATGIKCPIPKGTEINTTVSVLVPDAKDLSNEYTIEVVVIDNENNFKATENCFKPDTKVILETGEAVPMFSIVVGDKVCVGSKNGIFEFSEIYLISHCDLELKVLSGNHMVPVRVASVCTETHNGYIAPFTRTGYSSGQCNCSCYATCAPYQETIHAMLTPLRFTTWFKKSTHKGKEIHPYLGFLYNR